MNKLKVRPLVNKLNAIHQQMDSLTNDAEKDGADLKSIQTAYEGLIERSQRITTELLSALKEEG